MYISAMTINNTTPQYFLRNTRISITLLLVKYAARAAASVQATKLNRKTLRVAELSRYEIAVHSTSRA